MGITAMTTVLLLAGALVPAQLKGTEDRAVTVCMDYTESNLAPATIFNARILASRMFDGIGVKIAWRRDVPSCPAQGIVISLTYDTPESLQRGALAYSQLYEGTHICVFYDRILEYRSSAMTQLVLAHVFVHEITHILEGVSRHSSSGIMKATWSQDDYSRMIRLPLEFANDDIILIYQGLAHRAEIMNARTRNPMPAVR